MASSRSCRPPAAARFRLPKVCKKVNPLPTLRCLRLCILLPRRRSTLTVCWARGKVQDEGWELIKWHANHPNWAIGRGNAPARLDHFEAWARELYGGDVAEKIRVEAYANSLANAGRYDGLRVLPNWRNPIYDQIITPALEALYLGQGEVVETMSALKQQIQAEIPE